MRIPTIVALLFVLPVLLPARPAVAGPREREIKRLEQELATLEATLKQAMEFRARYQNLKANLSFFGALSRQDDLLLQKLLKYLNTPVSIFDAFLSRESASYERAQRAKWNYRPGQTTLWLKCRFGLQAVKSRTYYTVRVDVVDAQSGARIYQSLGPWQRRAGRIVEKLALPLNGIRVASGRYQIRVSVEVSGRSVNKLIPFQVGQGGRPPTPPPRGGQGVNTLGTF